MSIFSDLFQKISKRGSEKRAKTVDSQQSSRKEYLLDNNSPFNVTEAFRSLKASLSVSIPKKAGGIVMMTTSAFPKDGKTTVAVNLALMFAKSDAKVLLIDADIRKGRIAKYFKHKSTPGLSDYLSGQAPLNKVILHSRKHPHLSCIFCGTHSPKPYELLESNEMKEFIEKVRAEYDYILIDTPPILLISDALALSSMVDGAVLVCRHQVSYVSDIATALNTLQFSKINVLGVVVNDYKAPAKHGFYGENRYYSSYGSYGYTYGSTNPEQTDED